MQDNNKVSDAFARRHLMLHYDSQKKAYLEAGFDPNDLELLRCAHLESITTAQIHNLETTQKPSFMVDSIDSVTSKFVARDEEPPVESVISAVALDFEACQRVISYETMYLETRQTWTDIICGLYGQISPHDNNQVMKAISKYALDLRTPAKFTAMPALIFERLIKLAVERQLLVTVTHHSERISVFINRDGVMGVFHLHYAQLFQQEPVVVPPREYVQPRSFSEGKPLMLEKELTDTEGLELMAPLIRTLRAAGHDVVLCMLFEHMVIVRVDGVVMVEMGLTSKVSRDRMFDGHTIWVSGETAALIQSDQSGLVKSSEHEPARDSENTNQE